MRIVETQIVGSDHRSCLFYVVPEHQLQGLMQKVGGRMVRANRAPALRVHREVTDISHGELSLFDPRPMDDQASNRPGGVEHLSNRLPRASGDLSGVAHLTTRLAIKRRPVEDQLRALSSRYLGCFDPAFSHDSDQRSFPFVTFALVAE